MKKLLLMLVAILALALPAAAEETALYTCLFGKTANANQQYYASNNNYTSSFDATYGKYIWKIKYFNNNNNSWEFIKCGRKGNASVGEINTAFAMSEAITKVVVTIDAVTASSVNSITLYSAEKADGTTNEIEKKTSVATGDLTFTIADPQPNLYYTLQFDCMSASSNGVVSVSKVVYYGEGAEDTREEVSLTWSETEFNLNIGDEFTAPTLSATIPAALDEVVYSSSMPAVATVDETSGLVEIVGEGTAVITAKISNSDNFYNAEASYSITVVDTSVYYKLVTSLDEIQAGDVVVLTSSNDFNYAISTEQNKNNRKVIEVSFNKDASIVTINSAVMCFELGTVDTDKWTLKTINYAADEQGFLGSNQSSNCCYVTAGEIPTEYQTATIEFDSEETDGVKIEFASGASTKLRYNNTSKLFSCYNSWNASATNNPIYMYKRCHAYTHEYSVENPLVLVEAQDNASVIMAAFDFYDYSEEEDPVLEYTFYLDGQEVGRQEANLDGIYNVTLSYLPYLPEAELTVVAETADGFTDAQILADAIQWPELPNMYFEVASENAQHTLLYSDAVDGVHRNIRARVHLNLTSEDEEYVIEAVAKEGASHDGYFVNIDDQWFYEVETWASNVPSKEDNTPDFSGFDYATNQVRFDYDIYVKFLTVEPAAAEEEAEAPARTRRRAAVADEDGIQRVYNQNAVSEELSHTFSTDTQLSGVISAAVAANETVEYYNLQGVRVDNPAAGLYIRRSGSKVEKVMLR